LVYLLEMFCGVSS